MRSVLNNPPQYTLPGEEPMTIRDMMRAAWRTLVYAVMFGLSAGTVILFAYAVANSVGYP